MHTPAQKTPYVVTQHTLLLVQQGILSVTVPSALLGTKGTTGVLILRTLSTHVEEYICTHIPYEPYGRVYGECVYQHTTIIPPHAHDLHP